MADRRTFLVRLIASAASSFRMARLTVIFSIDQLKATSLAVAPGRWLSITMTGHSARVISNLGSTSVEKARVIRFDNTWIIDSTFSDAGKYRLLMGISFKSKQCRSLRCVRLISGQCLFKCRQSIARFHHFQHGRECREVDFIPFSIRNLRHQTCIREPWLSTVTKRPARPIL